jgi:hypothetical protein
MKPRHFLIVPQPNSFLFNGSQFVLSFGISMGGDLEYAQSYEAAYTEPKIDAAPESCSCNRIPTRQPTHDFPLSIFVAAIAFLLGFKIAAWMGRRQVERMREIWRK